MRKFIHVDMDAFYASVEQRDDPSLRGQPVVVAWRGARSVVCAASYEARKFGVRSAMPAVTAERLCPHAIFVPPDFVRYKEVSRQVREIFLSHTDLMEPLSLDEAYLDVTENKSGLATATLVAKAIRQQIFDTTHLTASAGVAPAKFLAKIASDWNKPNGLCVIQPHQVLDFLTPLPVAKLSGVGKVMQAKLQRLGIVTVGDVRGVDVRLLERELGRYAYRLHELALGVDHSSVQPDRPVQSISAEDTFAVDQYHSELEPPLRELAAKVWRSAARSSRFARTVVLKIKTSNFKLLTRSVTPATPPASAEQLTALAMGLLQRIDLPENTRFRLLGVGLSNFMDEALHERQAQLFPSDW